jgi:hypothetical protein
MSNQTALVLASTEVATRLGMEKVTMLETFKAQCFRNANNVSDSQLAAFVSIAREMNVNPLLPGMLYAYPTTGGGIVPMMGPDGVYKKLMEHPSVDSWSTKVFPEDAAVPPTHATTCIYLKGKEHAIEYTAYLNEWKVGSNPNWNSRPRHMLGLRSLKQAARQVIHGLPFDEDDRVIGDLVNVTPVAAEEKPVTPPRQEPPPRSKRGVAAVVENEAKAANPVIDVPAAPVVAAAPAPAAPVAAPAPEPVKEAEAVLDEPAAQIVLEDGKEVTVPNLKIERFVVKKLNGIDNSIQAEVSGAYTGTVYHFGGDCPAWQQMKAPVTLRLLGKKLKTGTVAGLVQSIEVTAVEADLE